jgi:hypothetical protein
MLTPGVSNYPRAAAANGVGGSGRTSVPDTGVRVQGNQKVFRVVTNKKDPGDQVMRWLRERCGKSEEVHSIWPAGSCRPACWCECRLVDTYDSGAQSEHSGEAAGIR